jgi:hypothetical protein
MKAVLFLAFAALVFAANQPSCPKKTAGKPNGDTILPGYKYSYDIPKGDAGHVKIVVDSDARYGQYLWVKGSADASTAYSASLHVKLNIDQQGTTTQPDWMAGSLTTGDASRTQNSSVFFGNDTTPMGSSIWLSFFPDCSACRSSVEFSVETAWVMGSTTVGSDILYYPIQIEDDLRTVVFKRNQGTWVHFYKDLALNDYLIYSVVYDGDTDPNSESVLYFNQGSPTTNASATNKYPLDGALKGDYLQDSARKFVATTAGTWYVSAYQKATTAGSADVTFKAGINKIPCADAASVAVSSFLFALIPLTIFFSKN